MSQIKCLNDAREALDADLADLTERAVATGISLFTSVEEVDSPEWWKARRLFIELAKAREIRGTLGFDEPPAPPAPPSPDRPRRRSRAAK